MISIIKRAFSGVFKSAGLEATAQAINPQATVYSGFRNVGSSSLNATGHGAGWQYGLSNSGIAPVLDTTALRNNARSAYHDSRQARSVVERYADIVPGVGLRLEATPRSEVLGITEEQAEEWSQNVEGAFDAFMSSKKFSVDESTNGYQSQRLVSIFQQRDGEYFARLKYSSRRDLLNPLQINFLDASQVTGYPLTNTEGLKYGVSGIKKDADGREVSYSVLVYDEIKKCHKLVELPKYGRRSGRALMIHGFMKEYAGQDRGYSRLGHALQAFENLTDFEYSHIKKAINEASIAMWVEPSEDNPATNPFENQVSGPASAWQAPGVPNDVSANGESASCINYSTLNEVNQRPGSMTVMSLEGGEKLREFNATTPSDQYEPFVNAFVKSLSASMSMPAEVLWMQFNQNYSASRATLVLAWQVVQIWRDEMSSDYLNPIYEMWLSGEIASGRISAPGWSDPRMRQAWLCNNWIGFPLPNIDPQKTAKADEIYIGMGAQDLDRVARNLNGSSGKANRRKLARQFEELPQSPLGNAGTGQASTPEEEEEEDKKGGGNG